MRKNQRNVISVSASHTDANKPTVTKALDMLRPTWLTKDRARLVLAQRCSSSGLLRVLSALPSPTSSSMKYVNCLHRLTWALPIAGHLLTTKPVSSTLFSLHRRVASLWKRSIFCTARSTHGTLPSSTRSSRHSEPMLRLLQVSTRLSLGPLPRLTIRRITTWQSNIKAIHISPLIVLGL